MNFHNCLKYIFGFNDEEIVKEEEIVEEDVKENMEQDVREIEEEVKTQVEQNEKKLQEIIEEDDQDLLNLLHEAENKEFIIRENNKEFKEIYQKSLTLNEIMQELSRQINEQQDSLNQIHTDTEVSEKFTMSALDKLYIKNLRAL